MKAQHIPALQVGRVTDQEIAESNVELQLTHEVLSNVLSASNVTKSTDTEKLYGSVLIIDDDPSMVQLMRRIFEQDGCEVTEARNGTSGLELFAQVHPDIVLLDVMMPGLNGFEVCEQLRALPGGERTAIILVTSLNDEQAVERAFEVGADDYITKPMRWNVLRHRLHRLLITKRAEDYAYFQASLLQQVHNAVVASDQNGLITYWNQAAERHFQWNSAEVIGRHIAEVMLFDDSERTNEVRTSAAGLGSWIIQVRANTPGLGSWNGELISQRKDGQTFPIHLTMALIKDTFDQLIGFVGVATDITERIRAEQALQEREASFRHLFANNPHPMWVRDTESLRFLDVNDATIARYGYSREEFLAMKVTQLYLPEDLPTLLSYLANDTSISGQWRHRLKNGRVIDVELSSHILEFGGQNAVLAVAQDITERKRAEEALTEERNLLRTLIDNISDYIFIKDNQSRFIINNRAHLTSLGVGTQSDATGKSDFDFFSPEEATGFFADEQTLLDTGQPLLNKEEIATNSSTNQVEWHNTTKAPLRDRNGHIVGLVGISHDITEFKKTQERLTEERNLLRTLIDTVPDHIFIKDRQSRFIINNRSHLLGLGLITQDEATGKTDFDFYQQEEADGFFAVEQTLMETGQPLLNQEEAAVDPALGYLKWRNTSKAPLRDLNGQIVGLVGISNDITELKRAQEKLTEERNVLHTMIDNLPDYIYVKDADERFVISNLAHAQSVHVLPHELIGKTAFDFFPPELAAKYHDDDSSVIRSGQSLINVERTTIDSAGQPRHVLTSKVALRDHDGNVVGLVGLSHDITERKRAEDIFLHLASIVESSDDGILGISLDGTITSWNPGAERIFGYLHDEIVGRSFSILSPADRLDEVLPMFEIVKGGESIRHFESLRLRKDGKKIDVALTISPLKDSTGTVTGISEIVHDITDRKQTERALSEYRYELEMLVEQRTTELSAANQTLRQEIVERNWADKALRRGEEQLRRITDNMLDMIWQTDIKGIIQYASPSCWNVLGYTPDALIGHSIYEKMDPEHLDVVMIALQTVGRVEYRYRDASGHYIWLESLSNLLFEDDTEAKGIILASRDITERKGTQGALQRSEERFRQLAENIDQVFWMSSMDDGEMIYVSPAYERMWGRSLQSLYAQPTSFLEAIHPEDRERIRLAQEKLSYGTYDEEYRIVQGNGAIRWIHSKAFPIHNEQGEVYRIAGISEDMTERKRVEQELQELNQLKTDFLSTAAHELRTPLTSIRGFSEILLTRELDETRRKRYLGLIDEQSTHLGQIIDDLLNLSRLEAKHNLTLDLQPMDVEELVDKVLPPFLESNPNRRVVLEGLQDCPPIVGDPFRISQVIRNLVSNAFKYSPAGGTIAIRGQMHHDYFQLSIQDSGIGMTNEQQVHLFEKFYRADASNLAIHGTGLGLAISKLIVELHGGQIWAESEYHVGTTFCFTLPLNAVSKSNQ